MKTKQIINIIAGTLTVIMSVGAITYAYNAVRICLDNGMFK